MFKCLNCNKVCKDTDKYCRNCGVTLKRKSYYILTNIFSFILLIGLIIMIVLFIASYYV